MYTLRIIEETRYNENDAFEQVIENFELGKAYSRVNNGTKEFDKIMMDLYPEWNKDEVLSIISGENEDEFFILKNNDFRQHTYFIMTESGKTFEKL